MEKYRPMLLKDFFSRFPDEDSCVDYFKDIRLSIGMKCPKCGGTIFKWYVDSILAEYFSKLTFPEYVNKASRLLQKEDKMNIKKAVKYIKMFAIPNQQYDTIKPFVEEAVAKESRTITDGGHNLIKLKELVKEHIPYPETEEDVHEVVKTKLPWVHIITGECRSGIEVIHKDVDKRFLQLYLNEYCWKFNRRFFRDRKKEKFDLFDHLIRISAQYTSDIKWRDYEKMANAINIC